LRDEKPESLPHGHQKALGVAIALASEPKVLLLDEPATGMNPSESDMMIDHIRNVRQRGTTVVVVEHDMRVVRSVCDRLVCMNFGQRKRRAIRLCHLIPRCARHLERSRRCCPGERPGVQNTRAVAQGCHLQRGRGEIAVFSWSNGAGRPHCSAPSRPHGPVVQAGQFRGNGSTGTGPRHTGGVWPARGPHMIASAAVLDNSRWAPTCARTAEQIQADIGRCTSFQVLKRNPPPGVSRSSNVAVARAS
jgi:hypothetical protein